MDSQHVDAIVKILPKMTLIDQDLDVAIGGGDHADIGLDGLVPAEPLEGLVLQHPQQFGLQTEGKLAELVQKQGAAVRLLEASHTGLVGAGEGTPLMTEQLAFKQGFRNVGAVHLDERLATARAVEVNVAGYKAFPRAGFSGDQNGRFRLGQPSDARHGLLHGRAGRNDAIGVVGHVLFAAQVIHFVLEAAGLHHPAHGQLQLFGHQRSRQEIDGASPNGFDDEVGLPVSGGGDDRRRRRQLLKGANHFGQRLAGLAPIEKNQGVRFLLQAFTRVLERGGQAQVEVLSQGIRAGVHLVAEFSDDEQAIGHIRRKCLKCTNVPKVRKRCTVHGIRCTE